MKKVKAILFLMMMSLLLTSCAGIDFQNLPTRAPATQDTTGASEPQPVDTTDVPATTSPATTAGDSGQTETTATTAGDSGQADTTATTTSAVEPTPAPTASPTTPPDLTAPGPGPDWAFDPVVKDTFSSIDSVQLPEFIPWSGNDAVIAEVNREIREIYSDLEVCGGDSTDPAEWPFAEYTMGIHEEVLSVGITYTSFCLKGPAYHYVSYHFNIKDGRRLTIKELVERAGYTSQQIAEQFEAYHNAMLILQWENELPTYDYSESDDEHDEYDDLMNTSAARIRGLIEADQLAGLWGPQGLLLYLPITISGAPRDHFIKEFWAEDNLYKMVVRNVTGEPLLALVNEADPRAIEAAKPKHRFIAEAEPDLQPEKILVIALQDQVRLALDQGEVSETDFAFAAAADGNLLSATLDRGESLYLEMPRIEGMPKYRLTAAQGEQTRSYYFLYNGRFEPQKLEILSAQPEQPAPLTKDSAIVRMAGVKAMNQYAFGIQLNAANPRQFWNLVGAGITEFNPAGFSLEEGGELCLHTRYVEQYAKTLWPEVTSLPEIPEEMLQKEYVQFNEAQNEYRFYPVYFSNITYRFVEARPAAHHTAVELVIEVLEDEKIVKRYVVNLEPLGDFEGRRLFGHAITAIDPA